MLAIGVTVVAATIALVVLSPVLSPSNNRTMPNLHPQTPIERLRSYLLPGHALVLISGYLGSNALSLEVANPTNSHSFKDCQVIQEIFKPYYENRNSANQTLRQQANLAALNVTLKAYDNMPPLFNDSFTSPAVPTVLQDSPAYSNLTEHADIVFDRSWFILTCQTPNETVAYPTVTVGGSTDAVSHRSGDTVTVRGIVGFSSVNLKIYEPGRILFANETLETGKGGSFVYSFRIPDNAERLGQEWFVDIVFPDTSSLGDAIRIE